MSELGIDNYGSSVYSLGADVSHNLITYSFVDGLLVPSETELCFCPAGSAGGGLNRAAICCDLGVSLGASTIIAFNNTTATYSLAITISVGSVPNCTERRMRVTSNYGLNIVLGPGTHNLQLTIPVTGGVLNLAFLNLCNNSFALADITIPGVPCCPFTVTFETPQPIGYVGNGFAYNLPIRFSRANTAGCLVRPATITSPFGTFVVDRDTSLRIVAPIAGGTFNFDLSDACGNNSSIPIVIPAKDCCQFSFATSVVSSELNGVNWDYELSFLLTEQNVGGCIQQTYTITSTEFSDRPIVPAVPLLVSFSVPVSRAGENMEFGVDGDCSGSGNTYLDFLTIPQPVCCKGTVEITDITADGSGNYTITFEFTEQTRGCISAGINNEWTIGTLTNPGITDGTLTLNTPVTVGPVALDPAGGTLVIRISYGCDNTSENFRFPYPADPPCCVAGLVVGDLSDLGITGSLRDIEIQIEITESAGPCTSDGNYIVTIDGNLVLADPPGTYSVGYQIPAPGSWTGELKLVNDCSGTEVVRQLAYNEPPCCNMAIGLRPYSPGVLVRVVSSDAVNTTYEIVPDFLPIGPMGCSVPSVSLASNVFSSRNNLVSGVPLTFTVNNANRPANLDLQWFYCDNVPKLQSTPLPVPCCRYNAELRNVVFSGFDNNTNLNVYSFQLFITPAAGSSCGAETLTLVGDNTVYGPRQINYNNQIIWFTDTFRIANGQPEARLFLRSSCGPANQLFFPFPLACCEPTFTIVSAPTITGNISGGGLIEREVIVNIGNNTGPNCAPHSSMTVNAAGFTTPIPVVNGNNTLRFFANSDVTLQLFGNCAPGVLASIPLTLSVVPVCCPFVTNPNPVVFTRVGVTVWEARFSIERSVTTPPGCVDPAELYLSASDINLSSSIFETWNLGVENTLVIGVNSGVVNTAESLNFLEINAGVLNIRDSCGTRNIGVFLRLPLN